MQSSSFKSLCQCAAPRSRPVTAGVGAAPSRSRLPACHLSLASPCSPLATFERTSSEHSFGLLSAMKRTMGSEAPLPAHNTDKARVKEAEHKRRQWKTNDTKEVPVNQSSTRIAFENGAGARVTPARRELRKPSGTPMPARS